MAHFVRSMRRSVFVLLIAVTSTRANIDDDSSSHSSPSDLHLNLPDDFFEKYFERETVVLPGSQESRQFFRSLWGFKHVLAQADREGFKAFKDGIAWKSFYSNPGDCGHCKAKVALQKNLSLVQNHVQDTHAPLAMYLKKVMTYFGIPGGINSYTTPPAGIGFGYHFDPSDAFIIQVHGSKRWELCSHKLTDRNGFNNLTYNQYTADHPELGECKIVTLEEGDVIYLPIGAIHRAAANDGLSVHLTMALNRQFCSMAPMVMNVAQQINPSKEYGFLQKNISDWVYRVSASTIGDMGRMHLVPNSLLLRGAPAGLPPSFLDPIFVEDVKISQTSDLPPRIIGDFVKNVAEAVMLLSQHPNASNEVLSLNVRMTNETEAVEMNLRPAEVLRGLAPLISKESSGRALLSWRKFFHEQLDKLKQVIQLNPNIILDWQLVDDNFTDEAAFFGKSDDEDVDSRNRNLLQEVEGEREEAMRGSDGKTIDWRSDDIASGLDWTISETAAPHDGGRCHSEACEDGLARAAATATATATASATTSISTKETSKLTMMKEATLPTAMQGDVAHCRATGNAELAGEGCVGSDSDSDRDSFEESDRAGEGSCALQESQRRSGIMAGTGTASSTCCTAQDAWSQIACANETAVALNPDEKVVLEDVTSVLLVTYATPQVYDFARYSLPLNALWARRFGHHFVVDQRDLAAEGVDAKNAKVLVKQYWLSHPDVGDNWVLWIGADAVFVSFDIHGEDVLRKLIRQHATGNDIQVLVTRDPHGRAGNSLSLFNADVILIRRSEWSVKFMQRWWDDPRMKEGRTDQEVLELLYLEDVMGAKSKFVLLPPLTLNSDTLSIVEKPPQQQPVVHLGGHSDGIRKKVLQHALATLCDKLHEGHEGHPAAPLSQMELPDLDLREVYLEALQAEVDAPPLAALSSGHFHGSTMSGIFQRLAWHLLERGRSAESIEVQRRALRWAKEKLGPKHRESLQAAVALAGTLRSQGGSVFLQESETLHRWALAGMSEVAGQTHRDTLSITNSLGLVLEAQGQLVGAEQQYRASYEGLLQTLGPTASATLSAGFNLATVLTKRALMRDAQSSGSTDWTAVVNEAEVLHRSVLKGKEAAFGADSIEAVESIDALVQLLVSQFGASKASEAEALQRKSLELRLARTKSMQNDTNFQRGVVQARSALAQALRMQGKLQAALEEFQHAYWACRNNSALAGDRGVNTFAAATNYAAVLQELERGEESLELLQGAVEGLTKALGPDHPNTRGAKMLYERSLDQVKMKQQ